jgi:hypothetical protein
MSLTLRTNDLEIQLTDHSPFASSALIPASDLNHVFGASEFISSRHGVQVRATNGNLHECVLHADGGASRIHSASALVRENQLLVAVGSYLCALQLPGLQVDWQVQVDFATCFGVYYSETCDAYFSHGELEVARVSCSGTLVWSASGKDIFSEGFELHSDHIKVIDFNREAYRIDLETGASGALAGAAIDVFLDAS